MSIPTVNVLISVNEQDGSPASGAQVIAKLMTTERYNGFVVPDEYSGVTDDAGNCTVVLFPNELGTEGSEYKFKIIHRNGKTINVFASIPNYDCSLHQVSELDRYELRGAGQILTLEVAQYANEAIMARDAAQLSETNASGYANQASSQATIATGQASVASTKAIEASASASAALSSANNAAMSEANAATSASNANTAKVAAESARDLASTYKTDSQAARDKAQLWAEQTTDVPVETGGYSAKHHATKAAASATAASVSKDTATTKASEAAASATAAANSATSASGSATTATTQASNAQTSANAASVSAGNASNSAATASQKATDATTSASAAATSATNGANSATAAATSKTGADTAKVAAEAARDAARASATAADGSKTAAASSASAAATSATNAGNSATAAATSATNASNSATSAAGSASVAVDKAIELSEAISYAQSMPKTIRAQSLPPVGNYAQGTFCVVDAYIPKKVYLNIGLAWIEIPATDALYGKITKYDDVKLLWRDIDGGQISAVGDDPSWSYADRMYAEDGSYVGVNEPYDKDGDGQLWWSGPSYTNLLTYSEQFDNAAWAKTNVSIVTGQTDPDGGTAAVRMVENTAVNVGHQVFQSPLYEINTYYTLSCYMKAAGRYIARLHWNASTTQVVEVDLRNGAILVSNSVSPVKVTDVGNGWYHIAITMMRSGTAQAVCIAMLETSGALTHTGDGVSGVYMYAAQFTKSSRPVPYIKTEANPVTVNSLPIVPAIHGDKGVWCGPGYQNLLTTGSGALTSWGRSNCTLDGGKVVSTIGSSQQYITLPYYSFVLGTTYTASVKIAYGGVQFIQLTMGGTVFGTAKYANFDIINGVLESYSGVTASIQPADDGFICSLTAMCTTAGATIGFAIAFVPSGASIRLTGYNGDGVSGMYPSNPQVTATSVPMPYVHPGTTVASAAGTSGNNGIWWEMAKEPDGVELVYNGGFDTTTDGWSSSNDGVLSVDTGRLKITNGSAGYTSAIQYISSIIGAKYKIRLTITLGTASRLKVFTGFAGSETVLDVTSSGFYEVDFVSTTATNKFMLQCASGTAAQYVFVDNISVQRLTSPLMQCFEKAETDGIELVTNGTFDVDTSGWAVSAGTLSSIDGRGVLAADVGAYAYQSFSTEVGKTYRLRGGLFAFTGGAYRGIRKADNSSASVNAVTLASSIVSSAYVDFVATAATTYIIIQLNGTSVGDSITVDNISVQKLKPATSTVAAVVTIGASSEDLANSTWTNTLTGKNSYGSTGEIDFGKSSGGAVSIITAYDGTTQKAISTGWSRNEQHIKIVQTNALGTQFRVGNKRIGINPAIQWSNWANFDGSFNPLTALRLAYGSTIPLWFKTVMVSNKGGMTDAEILTRLEV